MGKADYSFECSKCSNRLTLNDLYSVGNTWSLYKCPLCSHETAIGKVPHEVKPNKSATVISGEVCWKLGERLG